ncbi:hypothetical protein EJG51_008200 [Undibacterium piscinae]|uniref:Uncharacterized protein n=1 Tax=Undibacterium piscinae TaxID=2495591 RepID=A0A6M4A4G3_9BURK|nr:hypothetical protein EJG51_008200 [Undibacterium piscinae]
MKRRRTFGEQAMWTKRSSFGSGAASVARCATVPAPLGGNVQNHPLASPATTLISITVQSSGVSRIDQGDQIHLGQARKPSAIACASLAPIAC